MEVCIISPISHQNDFSPLGDLEMSLTHLVLENKEYCDYYKKKKGFIILDNSAFEKENNGQAFGPREVIKAQKMINANELICTDILMKGKETIESTKNFTRYFKAEYPNNKTVQLMAVPQGETIEEWFECYKELLEMEEIDTIGLSKISIPQCFNESREEPGAITKGRIMCTSEIVARGLEPDKYGKVIHLLGSDAWMGHEVRVQSQYKWIRSIDSSAPVHYGLNGHKMNSETGRFEIMDTDKPDLENKHEKTEDNCISNADTIYRNIAIVQKFAKGFSKKTI